MSKVDAGMGAMLDAYLFESQTLLEQLDEILLRTEQAGTFTEDDINEIFRIMHTVKGSSAMMGFESLQQLSHKGEDMFFLIRENKIQDTSFVYDLVFRMSDLLKAEIDLIQAEGDYHPTDFSDIIKELEHGADVLAGKATLDGSTPANAEVDVSPSDSADAALVDTVSVDFDEDFTTVKIYFEHGIEMENLRAFLLLNKILEETEVADYFPKNVEDDPATSAYIAENGFRVTFVADDKETVTSVLRSALNIEKFEFVENPKEAIPEGGVKSLAVETPIEEIEQSVVPATKAEEKKVVEKPAASKTPPPAPSPIAGAPAKQSIISVNLAKLDQLHDIVGEIITTESMVISNPELEGLQLESFHKAARDLRKLTDELQDTVMSIRMVPLSGPFSKMNRIVRDMKKALNKDVELIIEGETTEVDKSIVDNLNDPLMHLVRNCMDHGIETSAEDRVANGKSAKAFIKLAAANASGEVIITITDDGKGIDPEKVLDKAERLGLLVKPRIDYSEREAQNLITMPGFSTNEQVTEYSGRGVGMDVVKQNIEKCGGTVLVESKLGLGTTFIIKIPLTLAIIDGMEIEVGGTIFTIPISMIKQSFKVTEDQIIRDTQRGEMIMIRGECYPIMRLHERFGIPSEVTNFEDGILLLVETENKSVCLFSDKLIGEQQVVVKPFPPYFSRYNIKGAGLSGCTIMGDGSIALIIDVANLIEN
ncbi:MAG: chemotaxis protein CheA [Oscillospiraceae bacterium]|nr:chemotaxis protein CheA [Oscillospiraceae bacterium]